MEIKNNDTFIKIKNSYIKEIDNMLSSEKLTILTLITMNLSVKGTCPVTITWIVDTLGYAKSNSRKIREIKEILQEFINEGIMKVYKNILNCDENIVNDISHFDKNDLIYCELEDVNDEFTMIYDKELFELFKIADTKELSIYSLLHFVLYIYSFINNNEDDENYKLCFPAFKTIHEDIGISDSTIERYIDILKENKIIECDYAGYKETAKGEIRNGSMYYCRYQDKQLLIERLENIRKEKGFIKLNNLSKDKSNLKRKISQQINTLNKKKKDNLLTEVDLNRLELLIETKEKLEKER